MKTLALDPHRLLESTGVGRGAVLHSLKLTLKYKADQTKFSALTLQVV